MRNSLLSLFHFGGPKWFLCIQHQKLFVENCIFCEIFYFLVYFSYTGVSFSCNNIPKIPLSGILHHYLLCSRRFLLINKISLLLSKSKKKWKRDCWLETFRQLFKPKRKTKSIIYPAKYLYKRKNTVSPSSSFSLFSFFLGNGWVGEEIIILLPLG